MTVQDIETFGYGICAIAMLIGLGLLYLMPAIIADKRKLVNTDSIVILNIFLGWTFVGWVVCLAMAASGSAAVRPPFVKAG